LTIEDAYPVNPADLAEKTNVRDGVGIDRDTGAARENIKFNYEVLEKGEKGTFFSFRMQIENLGLDGPQDLTLLRLALALLQEGLSVGGKRAAGLGQIKLQKDSLRVHGFRNAQDLWAALQSGGDPHRELSLQEVLHA
jgi:CRISPR/Cas system CSM-associated protein Csm3 (group 7 of RAMP superfamily)